MLNITNILSTNIRLIPGKPVASLSEKNHFVVFAALRFPYAMLCPDLIKAQREGVPLTHGIRTIC